jgi:N-methylhydantoinase A/oxoprolinase/acetone carboxylase beta subunit
VTLVKVLSTPTDQSIGVMEGVLAACRQVGSSPQSLELILHGSTVVTNLFVADGVGPQSAGAEPGPAAYGRGGEQPTATDANVVLHRIPPGTKLAGSLEIDEDAARRAVATIAEGLGVDITEAAQAIIDIANENMHAALRVVSIERGFDPREFGLLAFGGAGPMHANALGRLIHAEPVVIPATPGVLSAFGFLVSEVQNEFARTYLPIAEETPAEGRFEAEHRRRYGFELDAPIEIATVRVVGAGNGSQDRAEPAQGQVSEAAVADRHEDVFFDGQWHATAIYDREVLQAGHSVPGPAIAVQQDTTTVIEPGYGGTIDGYGNIIIRKLEGN